jgi:type IV pilus assembly protein PilE
MKASSGSIASYFPASGGLDGRKPFGPAKQPIVGWALAPGKSPVIVQLSNGARRGVGMERGKQRGFTLIEMMITVVIAGILVAVAYPSYVSYIRKGVRKGAQAQMMDIANREQQFLLANRAYADYDALAASGYGLPADLVGKYTPTITLGTLGTTTIPTFTVTFAATGSQTLDGTLTFTSEGVKAPADKW